MFWRTDVFQAEAPKSGPIDKSLGREADPAGHRRQAKDRYFFFSNDLRGLTRRRIKVFRSSMSHSIVSPFSIVVASAMTAGKFT